MGLKRCSVETIGVLSNTTLFGSTTARLVDSSSSPLDGQMTMEDSWKVETASCLVRVP